MGGGEGGGGGVRAKEGADEKEAATRVERINAILTYETKPGQRMNAYGLKKFFGRDLALSKSPSS